MSPGTLLPKSCIHQGKSLAELILRWFLGRPALIFPDSDKSKALLKLGLPQLVLSRFHVIMLRCILLEFARQCHCHGQTVNLLYLLILLLSQTVEPQGLLDCSSVGFGFCFPAFLKYCHVSVFSRGMLALGSVLHVHPGCTHSNNMCKMLLKRMFFFSKLGP